MKSFLCVVLFVLMTSLSTDPSLLEVMNYISSVTNSIINITTIKVWATEDYYLHELLPSVCQYLFEEMEIIENIAPEGNPNRPGEKHEIRYIISLFMIQEIFLSMQEIGVNLFMMLKLEQLLTMQVFNMW